MYFNDDLFMAPEDDSRASRRTNGTAHSTPAYGSPKDSTRFNDYDLGITLEANGTSSVGFDSYIKAFAKPPQQPAALPAPTAADRFPKSKEASVATANDNFAFGLESFLHTVNSKKTKANPVVSSDSSSSMRYSTSSRNRAATYPITLLSPNPPPTELSMSGSGTHRRSTSSSRSTPTPKDGTRRGDGYMLDQFLGPRTGTTPLSVSGTTTTTTTTASTNSARARATPSAALHPRTTRASPLVMADSYLDSFLSRTTDSRSTRSTTNSATRRTVRPPAGDAVETEPYTPFLDAATMARRALASDTLDNSLSRTRASTSSQSQSRSQSQPLRDDPHKKVQPTPPDGVRRTSRRPSVTQPPALSRNNAREAVSASHSKKDDVPALSDNHTGSPRASPAGPKVAKPPSTSPNTTRHSPAASSKTSSTDFLHLPRDANAVRAMMAENPVAAAVRNSPAGVITLLPPLSPVRSLSVSSRRKGSDESTLSAVSDRGSAPAALRHHDNDSTSFPVITPKMSGGALSGSAISESSMGGGTPESGAHGDNSSHRRMSRPRPSGSAKEQQAQLGVVVPESVGSILSLQSADEGTAGGSAVSSASRRDSDRRSANSPAKASSAVAPTAIATPHTRAASFTGVRKPDSARTANADADGKLTHSTSEGGRDSRMTSNSVRSASRSNNNNTMSNSQGDRVTISTTSNGELSSENASGIAGRRPNLRKDPLPLQKPLPGIVSTLRLFDPKKPLSAALQRARGPPRRSLPNGKRQADWTPPVTSYSATIHDWCGSDDEEYDEDDTSVDVDIDVPPSATKPTTTTATAAATTSSSSLLRASHPAAIMVDEVDKKRLIASEDGVFPNARMVPSFATHASSNRAALEDEVRVSRSFDLTGSSSGPSFFKATAPGSFGSEGSPPPSRHSRRSQTPLLAPGMTPLDLPISSQSSRRVPTPLPRVSFAPGVEDIPF